MNKILIVDDDKINIILAKKLLSKEYDVDSVNSGEEALNYCNENIPDLILLDLQMPEMNGFEVISKLKSNSRTEKIPVIFLTADRSEETETKCFEAGAIDYISKPFISPIMMQRVRRSIEHENYKRDLESVVADQLSKISQLQRHIIITMGNLIESRDGTTGGHVKRTSEYVRFLLKQMQKNGVYSQELTSKFCEYVSNAAPLHDIGKITIPDAIIRSKERLSEEEFETIKNHAAAGGKIIKENLKDLDDKEFVQIASDIANYHHEKWNGKGYPAGLSGVEIPLCARIMTVADCFDALVSKRSYKSAFTLEEAFNIMQAEKGLAFESQILDAFTSAPDELKEIMQSLSSTSCCL